MIFITLAFHTPAITPPFIFAIFSLHYFAFIISLPFRYCRSPAPLLPFSPDIGLPLFIISPLAFIDFDYSAIILIRHIDDIDYWLAYWFFDFRYFATPPLCHIDALRRCHWPAAALFQPEPPPFTLYCHFRWYAIIAITSHCRCFCRAFAIDYWYWLRAIR